jgi:8-oxo-dGTP pyrophosphatase MutT (NUDIX family)
VNPVRQLGPPEAAVAIVHARAPEESVLLIRRTERESDAWSGHWSLPGGRSDPGDRDPLDTALRELAEECGILLTREQLESPLPHAAARRGRDQHLVVAPHVFRVELQLPTVLDREEAEEAFWIPLAVLRDPSRHALRPVPWRSPATLFPAVELQHVPLWGFTYRLLMDWLMPPPPPGAGAAAAEKVREFLSLVGQTGESAPQIPVELVVAHFSKPEHFLPGVNCLDVEEGAIRIYGPSLEEYVIGLRP